ncbi:MAG TPA: uracil-DNA glycosylase, partial [Chthoniobacterales bacterium]|nr:uracil-DNA glycosylase [Chthoniobacterales bacterium]
DMLRSLKHQTEPDFRADISALERIVRLPRPAEGSEPADPIEEPVVPENVGAPIHESLKVPAPPESLPPLPVQEQATRPGEFEKRFEELRSQVLACTKCPNLVAFRHTVVFGVGNPKAELMFVGEAPGADEDMQGEPFVGRAGELLTKIIQTMGYQRSDVYIANVLKCRPDIPPGSPNRQPTVTEMETCLPYLRQQIELIRPKIMVALGGTAMRGLFGTAEPMKQLRGRWHDFDSIPVMATFHPSYLLRNQALSEKRKVWEDMLQVLERLGRQITERQKNYFLGR